MSCAMTIPAAISLTHQHLLAVVHTLVRNRLEDGRWREGQTVRLMDAGCGKGAMLAYFARALPFLVPEVQWELFGYDVSDSGVQEDGDFADTIARLSTTVPDVPWLARLRCITSDEPWPYADNTFDVIVSNQVGEHVEHFDQWLREQRRTLRPHGVAVHLFPLAHYVWEGHLFLPLVHRIASHDLAAAYTGLCLRLGLSFRQDGGPLEWSAASHADYLRYNTWYRRGCDVLWSAKRAGIRASFRYSWGLYAAKLRQRVGLAPRLRYATRRVSLRDALRDWLGYTVAKRLASVTLVCERENVYRQQPAAPSETPRCNDPLRLRAAVELDVRPRVGRE